MFARRLANALWYPRRMANRIALITALALLPAFGCSKDRPVDTPTDAGATPAVEGEPLSFTDALKIAAEKFPDAPAIEVEMETVDGQELIEVEFLVDGQIKELYLDPKTGDVVQEKDEELEPDEAAVLPTLAEQIGSTGVKLADVIALAESKYDAASIREIELEISDGRLVMVVEVAEGDGTKGWRHDPSTGDVLGEHVEEDDEGDEGDEGDGDKETATDPEKTE